MNVRHLIGLHLLLLLLLSSKIFLSYDKERDEKNGIRDKVGKS